MFAENRPCIVIQAFDELVWFIKSKLFILKASSCYESIFSSKCQQFIQMAESCYQNDRAPIELKHRSELMKQNNIN